MKSAASLVSVAFCAGVCAFTFSVPAIALSKDDKLTMTPAASAASAAAPSTAHRRLGFRPDHAVASNFTLLASKGSAIADGYAPQVKFEGQANQHQCVINLPKASQKVQPGETAVVTLKCHEEWEVYDNGLSYVAYEGGKKVGEGTIRP